MTEPYYSDEDMIGVIATILRQHRDYREDGLCATCACGAGLFTFEAHEAHVAAAVIDGRTRHELQADVSRL